MVGEVGAVLEDFPTNAEYRRGGVSEILDRLDHEFPSLLYQKYQMWECQEVGGASEDCLEVGGASGKCPKVGGAGGKCPEVGGAGQVLGTRDRGLVLKVKILWNEMCTHP